MKRMEAVRNAENGNGVEIPSDSWADYVSNSLINK